MNTNIAVLVVTGAVINRSLPSTDMNTGIAVLVATVIVAGIGAIFFFCYRWQKKRTEALGQVAGELRLIFSPEGDETLMSELGTFHLFSQGHSKKIRNLMRGKVRDLNVAIFDYQYVDGYGKNSHTWSQTVISLQLEKSTLPSFSLRPENVLHKLVSLMGYQDIDFESNPDFSKKYLLRGRDEAAVRGLFRSWVLTFFEAEPGLWVEGEGNKLIVYRQSAQVNPEAIRAFLDKGLQILDGFQR